MKPKEVRMIKIGTSIDEIDHDAVEIVNILLMEPEDQWYVLIKHHMAGRDWQWPFFRAKEVF